jgi:heme-degrading monooxygenase HmoA
MEDASGMPESMPRTSRRAMSEPESSPITTLTVFSFPQGERFWAFSQMALSRPLLAGIEGMRFRKLMGTGRGRGFTRSPDWSRYAFLAVWDREEQARGFLDGSRFMRRYRRHTAEISTVILATVAAHGTWNGRKPFGPPAADTGGGALGVLTRATIRPARLRAFWERVDPVSAGLNDVPGLIASVGIGEAPFIRQATFSLWESTEAMQEFAYRSPEHREVVRRTRAEGWYSEDLFARFHVLDIIGRFPPAGLGAE